MNAYDAAQSSLIAGLAASAMATVGLVANGIPSFLATATDPTGTTLESLLPQLGIFTVVIVVFKFMLGRQDVRDERSNDRDNQIVEQLRADMDDLRTELLEERKAHAVTRQQLVDYLLNHPPK